jgi:hypothetical protein
MSVNSELFDILLLRTTPQYHAAEVMRRAMSAAAMASSPETSQPYASIRLMIGTWETIANRVRGNAELTVPFYENNPVGHMWNALSPAIKIIRGEFKARSGTYYAAQFEKLNRSYKAWLKTKPAGYRTAALQGLNAQFG